jgi:hypothetical protein
MTPPHTQVPARKVLSLKLRVKRFYTENPTEELTYPGVMEKFSCTKWAARWIVRTLVEDGFIESVHVIRLRTQGIAREPA